MSFGMVSFWPASTSGSKTHYARHCLCGARVTCALIPGSGILSEEHIGPMKGIGVFRESTGAPRSAVGGIVFHQSPRVLRNAAAVDPGWGHLSLPTPMRPILIPVSSCWRDK